MRRVAMTVGLVLSVVAGTGIGHAHDKNGAAPAAPQRVVAAQLETRATLTALAERVTDTRVTLAERVDAAKARQRRLASLIADDPGLVLRHALAAKVRSSLPSDARQYLEEHATTDGKLEVMHADGGKGDRYYYFLNRAGERLALHFAVDAPVLQTGDRVRVSGVRVQQAMAVGSGSGNVTALALAPPSALGAQNTAVILVAFIDKPMPAWITASEAQRTILSTDPASTSSFFREVSYGQTWLTGDVYGPYVIPISSAGCATGSVSSYGRQAATAQVGAAKVATYNRFVYVMSGGNCGWSGLGTVGGSPSEAWIGGSLTGGVVHHEMGHNLGLWHSHALLCVGVSVGTNCTTSDYGDSFDVMGNYASHMHFNAVQKDRLGWLDYGGSPPITTVQTSGVYTIEPLETPGDNPKALKVRTPSGDWYYVEYRQALGFDAARLAGETNVTAGVLVHLWRGQNDNAVFLLDMTPDSPDWGRPALGVGDVFSDPASGITIAPVWVNGTAGVNVTVGGSGGPICVRKSPTVTVSPAQQQGQAGTTLSYAVTVTNTSTGCPAPSYTMQATLATGWTASMAPSGGAATSMTIQLTSPLSAAVGMYTIAPKIFDTAAPTYSVTTQAKYSVASGGAGGAGTFSDDFNRVDSGALGNGWTAVSGVYGVQSGMAVAQGNLSLAIQASLSGQTTSAQAAFVRPTSASGAKFGVVVRYQNAKNYYVCYRMAGGSSLFRVAKVLNGVEYVLKAVSVPQAPLGTPFTVSCAVSGNVISVGDGSAIKATATDVAFLSGSVGIQTDKAGLKLDNFSASAQ